MRRPIICVIRGFKIQPQSGAPGSSYEASLRRPQEETFTASFEELKPVNGAKIEDFDLPAIKEYMGARDELSRFRRLMHLGLITREGTGRSTRYLPRFSAPDAKLTKG